jgi:hypothetical protein
MLSVLVPNFLKRRLNQFLVKKYYDKWQQEFIRSRENVEQSIPKYLLSEKHIVHLQILLDREALLQKMPKHAVCAEIGVNEGEFSQMIVNATTPNRLHLIDAWGDPTRYHDGLKLKVKELFKEQINRKQVEINVGFSTDVLAGFPDHYFDWVYLDTDHTYPVTAAELAILKDKVKPTGIIAGHDYTIGNWANDCRYGVIEAVHELCVKDNWEIIYLTMETNQFRSFAIKKII